MEETLSKSARTRLRSQAWVLAACLVAAPALASAAEAPKCITENHNHIARKLGTRNSFVRGGVKSVAELQSMFKDHSADIACLLESRGLGRLADKLAAAAGSATSRPLANNECFAWQAYRKGGKKAASAPLCMKTTKTYDTWDISFDELISEKIVPPMCKITASGDPATQTLAVNTAGSTPGATVTWTSSDGRSGSLAGSSMPWTNLCTADYTFAVAAKTEGTRIIAKHSFSTPAICGNLGYIGATERTETFTQECRETATVPRHVPPPPPVTLSATPPVVKTKYPVSVVATADSVCLASMNVVTKDPRGAEIDRRESTSSPIQYETSFKKPGVHSFEASATDAIGQTGTAPPTSVRVRPRWTLRFFGASINPDDERIMTERRPTSSTLERTAFSLDNGFGVGAAAEYHATERVGIEGSFLLGRVDSSFKLDLNGDWAMQDDKIALRTFSVGPNFHFFRSDSPVDVYVGPFVTLAQLGEGKYTPLGRSHKRDLDDEVTFGAQLGFDFHWNPQWAIHAGLRYVDLDTDLDLQAAGKSDISVNPLSFTGGLSYSF